MRLSVSVICGKILIFLDQELNVKRIKNHRCYSRTDRKDPWPQKLVLYLIHFCLFLKAKQGVLVRYLFVIRNVLLRTPCFYKFTYQCNFGVIQIIFGTFTSASLSP